MPTKLPKPANLELCQRNIVSGVIEHWDPKNPGHWQGNTPKVELCWGVFDAKGPKGRNFCPASTKDSARDLFYALRNEAPWTNSLCWTGALSDAEVKKIKAMKPKYH